ncbi:ABC transporter permease [Microvirga sp. VF16]|uniref:ABC transporter permease n=1 Tax=Microvirga sp. VF16 TaxID=2807101 RepID=UPI00193DED63|nr:ABC transporter permease [Microvirga sp. VF16]QRM29946.1 ABC transporter permease [Microvirga sp. VF16]
MTTVPTRPLQSSVAIEDITGLKERSLGQRLLSSQPFWVTIALVIICAVMAWDQPDAFATSDNFFNITRNFAFIGIMAVGMTAVILTGGIDLSVGSLMGLVGVVCGLILQAEYHWAVAILAGLLTGAAAGAVNGFLVAYVGLPAFVVTLGMLSAARSLAIVLSENRMIYEFGPWGETFNAIGGDSILGIANPVWVLAILALIFGFIFNFTAWGNYLYAIGSNEDAARLTGVPVRRVKLQAYIVSGLTAALASVLIVGWQGSAINALGQGYELRVIASTVIGGADLMGGQGGAYGAVIGAALIEVIRNSLLMAGVDANWQGAFVGLFIVLAVLLQRIRGKRSA